MGLEELGGTEAPKPAQQGLVTAGAGTEAVYLAGEAKQSPRGAPQGGGICDVLLHLPSTHKESGQQAGVQLLEMGLGPRDGDVCKRFPTRCFFP